MTFERAMRVRMVGFLAATLGVAALGCAERSSVVDPMAGGTAGAAPVTTGGIGGSAGSSPIATAGVGGMLANGGNAGAGGSGGVGGSAPELFEWHFFGRWDLGDPAKAITVNSGSHVATRFNGSGISASFDIAGNTGVRPTVSWKIDEGDWLEAEIAASLPLASGLALGQHDVTLFVRGMSETEERWTPPLVSATTFKGFTASGGTITKTARPTRLKIEFLGDSITEGVLVHQQGPAGQNTQSWRTDGPKAFAALTAVALNAEWRQVGFGRQGLTIEGNGGVPKAADAFDWIYAGVPRDDWQPDFVVINQGTNDRGAGAEVFEPLYGAFLNIVRNAYPDAKIVALQPLVGDFGTQIEAQVASRKAAGDSKVFYVGTTGWTSAADFTDGLHPNVSGSAVIRDRLVPVLQGLL